MSYVALYRKYRPKIFDEVYGQSAIVQTLKNQILSNRISHAYLFSGPRGTGKTSISKLFAQTINCEHPVDGNACMQCDVCQKTLQGINIDITEIDAASNNGVDNIRSLIEESKYRPQYGKYRVYIIDEVHMLSNGAFNALLKTLEEPSQDTIFILATTEESKVPATIYSRCQRYQFKLINDNDIVQALKNVLTKEQVIWDNDETLLHIAKLSAGGLRDAFSLLDQCITYSSGNMLTLDIVKDILGEVNDASIVDIANAIENKEILTVFDMVDKLVENGKSLSYICMSLYNHYKDKYFSGNSNNIIFQRYMKILAELSEKLKYNNNRVLFEVNIIKMCTPEMETDYSALYQRMSQLEDIVKNLMSGNIQTSKLEYDEAEFKTIRVNIPRIRMEVYNV